MTAGGRALALAGVIALLVFGGLRIHGLMQAERYAATEPQRALAAKPDDPRALLALAERRLREGDAAGAAAMARRLLAHEPLEGRAFRVLGAAEARLGRKGDALRMYRIAARRAPRDIATRAWLAQHYLEAGSFREALVHVDFVLRTTPGRTKAINEILKKLAPMVQTPEFADALAEALRSDPPWRAQMLVLIRAYPDAAGRVMQRLQSQGDLDPKEYADWLAGLMAQDRWGEAYARWAGHAVPPGRPLPLLYNGDFATPPAGVGFDWYLEDAKGVLSGFAGKTNGSGGHVRLQFLDEEVDRTGLRHPLLLFPGRYRFSVRMRAGELQGLEGLVWRINCTGKKATELGRGTPIQGSFNWRPYAFDFVVPAEHCPNQWLSLVNGAEVAGLRRLAGELWIDDADIQRLAEADALPARDPAPLAITPRQR